MKILIVDDDEICRQMLSRILLQEGLHEITTAFDGENALRLLESPKFHFDVLFLDIEMPKVNGIEVLKKLRAEGAAFADLKIIVCSSVSLPILQDCLKLGAQYFVTKPARKEVVHQKLHLAVAA